MLRFSFLQERESISLCNSPVLSDFLKLSMVQECLKHSKVIYHFCRIKSLKLLELNAFENLCNEYFSHISPPYIESNT